MSQQSPEDSRDVQDARAALLGYFGDHLRFWGTNVLALAVALFAAVQVRDFLSSSGVFVLTLVFLVMEGVYAFARAIFHGRVAQFVIRVQPADDVQGPLMSRLLEAAVRKASEGVGVLVSWSSGFLALFLWTVIAVVVGLAVNYWLGLVG